ncbi:MAG: hypothetical protein PHI06_07130 [Desulfobulbaceae bacterium]|nr:hypothetical protein [Desulfobulbaceae bacterium]
MDKKLPDGIRNDLAELCRLHERTSSDSVQCQEFNKRMSRLLADLEDAGCFRIADRVMTVLLHCNPKEGSNCDKATIVAEKMKKMCDL